MAIQPKFAALCAFCLAATTLAAPISQRQIPAPLGALLPIPAAPAAPAGLPALPALPRAAPIGLLGPIAGLLGGLRRAESPLSELGTLGVTGPIPLGALAPPVPVMFEPIIDGTKGLTAASRRQTTEGLVGDVSELSGAKRSPLDDTVSGVNTPFNVTTTYHRHVETRAPIEDTVANTNTPLMFGTTYHRHVENRAPLEDTVANTNTPLKFGTTYHRHVENKRINALPSGVDPTHSGLLVTRAEDGIYQRSEIAVPNAGFDGPHVGSKRSPPESKITLPSGSNLDVASLHSSRDTLEIPESAPMSFDAGQGELR